MRALCAGNEELICPRKLRKPAESPFFLFIGIDIVIGVRRDIYHIKIIDSWDLFAKRITCSYRDSYRIGNHFDNIITAKRNYVMCLCMTCLPHPVRVCPLAYPRWCKHFAYAIHVVAVLPREYIAHEVSLRASVHSLSRWLLNPSPRCVISVRPVRKRRFSVPSLRPFSRQIENTSRQNAPLCVAPEERSISFLIVPRFCIFARGFKAILPDERAQRLRKA